VGRLHNFFHCGRVCRSSIFTVWSARQQPRTFSLRFHDYNIISKLYDIFCAYFYEPICNYLIKNWRRTRAAFPLSGNGGRDSCYRLRPSLLPAETDHCQSINDD
jgi:hypothetical protein